VVVGAWSDGLAVAEEFVVFVVAAVSAADLGVVGDELDALDPVGAENLIRVMMRVRIRK